MKLLSFICLLVFFSCNTTVKDEVKDFIPGTYVRASEHEFGVEHDTLLITLQNPTANEYKIVRRWKYDRVLDGKPVAPEYKNTNTTGIYNGETKMLQETETAETYSFDPKQNALFAGSTKYQKLK